MASLFRQLALEILCLTYWVLGLQTGPHAHLGFLIWILGI